MNGTYRERKAWRRGMWFGLLLAATFFVGFLFIADAGAGGGEPEQQVAVPDITVNVEGNGTDWWAIALPVAGSLVVGFGVWWLNHKYRRKG